MTTLEPKSTLLWVYGAAMGTLTVFAEYAQMIEPNPLVWMLGLSGAIFGAAFFPSKVWWRTLIKLAFGTAIAGVAASPLSASHYMPIFVNQNVAALWLGFAGPAIFVATLEAKFPAIWVKRP